MPGFVYLINLFTQDAKHQNKDTADASDIVNHQYALHTLFCKQVRLQRDWGCKMPTLTFWKQMFWNRVYEEGLLVWANKRFGYTDHLSSLGNLLRKATPWGHYDFHILPTWERQQLGRVVWAHVWWDCAEFGFLHILAQHLSPWGWANRKNKTTLSAAPTFPKFFFSLTDALGKYRVCHWKLSDKT